VTGDIPTGRSGHSASLLSDHSLDTTRWKWMTPPKIVGDAPRPRSYHTATSMVQGKNVGTKEVDTSATGVCKDWIVVIGGNDHDSCFNSVHVLEIHGSCWSWINPLVSGDIPSPRTGHVAELMEDGKTILIQGGWDPNAEGDDDSEVIFDDCYLLDTSTWIWTKLEQTAPSRVGHRSVHCKGDVYMFGGRLDGGEFTNDLFTLNWQ
jgi:hypothetical protein